MADVAQLSKKLYLLGTDNKMYRREDDGRLVQVEHSEEFHGFGVGNKAFGVSDEEAKAQSQKQDVSGHHGYHCYYAYGPYFDVFYGVWTVGWHTHC